MYISLFETIPIIKDFFGREKPDSVLVVSLSPTKYVRMMREWAGDKQITIDKVDFSDSQTEDFSGQRIYRAECLMDGRGLRRYDFIFVTDVFERVRPTDALKILDTLLACTERTLLVLLPEISVDPANAASVPMRAYHPTFFKQYDFSFIVCTTVYGKVQLYSFFPIPQMVKSSAPVPSPSPQTGEKRKLRIGYILPHKHLTGGIKCLLEQMRQFHRRGHTVYAIYEGETGESAIPEWSDIDPTQDIDGQLILTNREDLLRLSEFVDVVMLGFINQLRNYSESLDIPVVYWEQGYEALYGDFGRLLDSHAHEEIQAMYHVPVHLLSVADIVSDILRNKYGIKSHLLYNGIDTDAYYPQKDKKFSGTVLLVGNPALAFKNFNFALQVLNEAWARGNRFRVKWACQVQPQVSGVSFPIEYFLMVSQQKLAELYRTSDIFLFTSVYESFPMPPIEAMASGVPVIATNCGGILTYGRPGENFLLVDQGDLQSCVAALAFLLENENARNKLSENGLITAQNYNFSKVVENLENYFIKLTAQKDGGEKF